MARGDSGRELNVNLRQSVGAARSLTFALGDMGGKLGSAGLAAGLLAENIAKAAGATKALTQGLTFGVAAIATIVAGTIAWKDGTKELAQSIAAVKRDIGIINAGANQDKRLERELQIVDAMEKEVEAAERNESILRKLLSPDGYTKLLEAIRAKGAAAIAANNEDAKRVFQAQSLSLFQQGRLTAAGFQGPEEVAREQARQAARTASDEVNRGLFDTSSDPATRAIGREQLHTRIQRNLEQELKLIDFQRVKAFGDQLGQSLVGAISDGIITAIQKGKNIGQAFDALKNGILVGLGDLMISIGTHSLLAANLFQKIITALNHFSPDGAIGPALALIAAGSALKGLAQRSGGGGQGRAGGGSYSSGSGGDTVIYRGLVNPLNPFTSTSGITPAGIFAPTIIGTNDAKAQRDLYTMWDKYRLRIGMAT